MLEVFDLVEALLKRKEISTKVYELDKKIISDVEGYIKLVQAVINIIHNYYKVTLSEIGQVEDRDNKIITGISETVDIKISVLKDHISEVKQQILDEYIDTKYSIMDEYYNSLIEITYIDELDYGIAIDKIQLESEDKLTELIISMDKDLIRSIKEGLIYELSTLEDLLRYSIPVLSEVTLSRKEFYIMDDNIIKALNSYGISIIKPTPHSKFDSREQEIIIADAQDGYTKGEVIEVLNRGYKLFDIILKRASITACK